MIIVLKANVTQPQIDHVLERIAELGLRAHMSKGEVRTIIGVIGDGATSQGDFLEALNFSGVFKAQTVLFVAAIRAGAWTAGLMGALFGFVAGSTIRSIIMGGAAWATASRMGVLSNFADGEVSNFQNTIA